MTSARQVDAMPKLNSLRVLGSDGGRVCVIQAAAEFNVLPFVAPEHREGGSDLCPLGSVCACVLPVFQSPFIPTGLWHGCQM